MNVIELRDYILTQMTAEQALTKLLEGHVLTYQKLKFNEGQEIHPEILIAMAAFELGWSMAFPVGADENDILKGIIVGTQDYIDSLVNNCGDCGDNCCKNCGD